VTRPELCPTCSGSLALGCHPALIVETHNEQQYTLRDQAVCAEVSVLLAACENSDQMVLFKGTLQQH
jgi:hypothetical protein